MKNTKWISGALVSLLVYASLAHAGQEGHGGRVWVCYKPANPITGEREIDTVEFVDYKEANGVFNKWTIDLGKDVPNQDDVPAMLDVAIKRLNRIDALRSKQVADQLIDIQSHKSPNGIDLEKDRGQIAKIPDGNYLLVPATGDCDYRQAAFNLVKPKLNEFKYVFVKQYWDRMNDTDRAGLLLHEAIYNLEAGWGATDSDGSRHLVMAISSPMLETILPFEYLSYLIENSKRPGTVTIDGVSFKEASATQEGFFAGSPSELQTFKSIAICPEADSCASKKIFNIPVSVNAGESMIAQMNEEKSKLIGIASGGVIETPAIRVFPQNVTYKDDEHFVLHKVAFKNFQYNIYTFNTENTALVTGLDFNLLPGTARYDLDGGHTGNLTLHFDKNKVTFAPPCVRTAMQINYDQTGTAIDVDSWAKEETRGSCGKRSYKRLYVTNINGSVQDNLFMYRVDLWTFNASQMQFDPTKIKHFIRHYHFTFKKDGTITNVTKYLQKLVSGP